MNVRNTVTITDDNTKEHIGKISFSQHIIGRKGLQISENFRYFYFSVATNTVFPLTSEDTTLSNALILPTVSAYKRQYNSSSCSLPHLQHFQVTPLLKLH